MTTISIIIRPYRAESSHFNNFFMVSGPSSVAFSVDFRPFSTGDYFERAADRHPNLSTILANRRAKTGRRRVERVDLALAHSGVHLRKASRYRPKHEHRRCLSSTLLSPSFKPEIRAETPLRALHPTRSLA